MPILGETGKVRGVRNETSLLQKAVLAAFGLPVLLMVFLPICGLVESISPATFFQNLNDSVTLEALKLSGISSAISTGLVVLFGTPLALLIARSGRCGFLRGLVNLSLFVPPAVAGLGLLMVFGGHLSLKAVVLAQFFVAAPYFIRAAAGSLGAVPAGMKEMVLLEGGSGFQIFTNVTLPFIWRGFVAGAAMAWARGLGEFGATLIFAGNLQGKTQTLPLAIFGNFAQAQQQALAVALVLLVMALALGGVALGVQKKRA